MMRLHIVRSPSESTLEFYNQHAEEYCAATRDLDLSGIYHRFLAELPSGAHILDAGCGCGRDTKVFLERGHKVTAIDASPELPRLATLYTRQECGVLRFQ